MAFTIGDLSMTRYQTTSFVAATALIAVMVSSATFAQVTSNSVPPTNLSALQAELDKSFQSSAAMRVYRDPKTGEFRHDGSAGVPPGNANNAAAGQTEAANAANAANAKQSTPTVVKLHSNGMKSATAGEGNMRYATVHRHTDGSLHTDCVEGHSLAHSLANPASQVKGEKHVR
jgi:hypothetical protein